MKAVQSKLKQSVRQGRFLKMFLLGFVLFSALFSVASKAPVMPRNNETERAIKNYFRFPQVLLPHAEPKNYETKKVEVLFTTGQNGKVNFALAKTNDQALKQEVEKQFYKLQLPKLSTDVVHSVVLSFKAL